MSTQKKYSAIVLFAIGAIAYCSTLISEVYVEDEILSVIYGAQEPIVITQLDVKKAKAEGKTVIDLEREALIYQNATHLKINTADDAADKMLAQILKRNRISQEQLLELLAAENMSLEAYKEQLKKVHIIHTMLDFRVYSRAPVSYEEVMHYYHAHPIQEEEAYAVATAVVPYDLHISKKEQHTHLKASPSTDPSIRWNEPFWVKPSELAQDKLFITQLVPGRLHAEETIQGFLLYKVTEKKEGRIVPLQERYDEIVYTIREPRIQKLLNAYYEELFSNAIIVRF